MEHLSVYLDVEQFCGPKKERVLVYPDSPPVFCCAAALLVIFSNNKSIFSFPTIDMVMVLVVVVVVVAVKQEGVGTPTMHP